MKISTEALRERARQLLIQMTEQGRWIYALPRKSDETVLSRAQAIATKHALVEVEHADEGRVAKHVNAADDARIVFYDRASLDMVFVEATGAESVPAVREIVDLEGFVPQSKLWGQALDVKEPGASDALKVLSHMAVEWDADWTDLFILHLSSPDPIMRHEAVTSLTLAAMVAREVRVAQELLKECLSHEKYPKLADTMKDASRVLDAMLEGTVTLDPTVASDATGSQETGSPETGSPETGSEQ